MELPLRRCGPATVAPPSGPGPMNVSRDVTRSVHHRSSPEYVGDMADLDLSLVRGFAVVVEHCHFGRAAAELYLTQSLLSWLIVWLDQQVGARLLDRTPQGTRLTEAGEAFLPLAAGLLRAAAHAAAHARAPAAG